MIKSFLNLPDNGGLQSLGEALQFRLYARVNIQTIELKDNELILKSVHTMPCLRCGTCCSKFDVRVTLEEAHLIVDTLGISWDEWMNGYINTRWPGTKTFILRRINNRCIFLKQQEEQLLCSIHSFKPSLCIEWKEGIHRKECRQGLKQRWGIIIDAAGNLNGTPQALQRYRSFLTSLDGH